MGLHYKAEQSQHRNDLHWSIWTPNDGRIVWHGYNDANWWDNVASLEHTRTRAGDKTGNLYVIDFKTGDVEVVAQET